jgi:AcrR family transcriptional regulator
MPRRAKNDPTAPELNLERLVRVAIELIDADGLDNFSLRGLARRLGAGNMSVYHYVNDRDHLLALVLDEILGSVKLKRLPDDPLDAVATISKRFVAAFAAHPATIPLFALQPIYSIGPNGLALFDHLVGLLRRAKLSDDTVAHTTVALFEYLCGHLIGHLPQTQHPDQGHAKTVDDIITSLPPEIAPNIQALGPELRRAASTLQPNAGINLILSSLRALQDSPENIDASL